MSSVREKLEKFQTRKFLLLLAPVLPLAFIKTQAKGTDRRCFATNSWIRKDGWQRRIGDCRFSVGGLLKLSTVLCLKNIAELRALCWRNTSCGVKADTRRCVSCIYHLENLGLVGWHIYTHTIVTFQSQRKPALFLGIFFAWTNERRF